MEYELKLLNMLGYKVVPLYENRWSILDDNNKLAGFIQKKKLHSKNVKKELPAVFGYVTKIDSDTISYSNARGLDEKQQNFGYTFDIKCGEETDHVQMSIGKAPHITIWSKEYGYMSFDLSYNGLFLNFKSKTSNFNIEETTVLRWNRQYEDEIEYEKEYSYCISYCDKDSNIEESKKRISCQISAKYGPNFMEPNQLEVQELNWENNILIKNKESKVKGTIEEIIQKHQMGIESLSHFRFLLRKILPFKQEAISIMTENYNFSEKEVELFLPDLVKQKQIDSKKKQLKA